jgi:hypothetical protein
MFLVGAAGPGFGLGTARASSIGWVSTILVLWGYSNRARGTRKAEAADPEAPTAVIEGMPEQVDPEASRAAWDRLIKKMYEAGPWICPHCGGSDAVPAVIGERLFTKQILHHLALWTSP